MIPYKERLRQLNNATAPVSARPTADVTTIFDALRRLIVEVLQLPDGNLDPKRSFKDLGLSSLLAVRLLDRINRHFSLRMGVEALFNYGDPLRLAAHIAALAPSSAATPITREQKRDADKNTVRSTVAIIGYAGKFAGAENPDALWQALSDNRPLISQMPGYRRQDLNTEPPLAGFLSDAERFDAAFFGISPREAAAMDPVQRHFLEQAWCALEHAGLTQRQLAGKRIGVYAGASGSGYEHSVPISGKAVDAYVMTGNLASMTAARVAYFLDLDGPAVTVDTACSSSLTAVHLACQALLSGEIDIAIAGGASLFIDERAFEAMARAGMTSPSHACRAFDDRADGIVVAEGAGCVILKTTAQAQADGDRIEANICASSINQDGRSNGITAPNALAQAKLLRQVLEKAQISKDSIDLVETHGTGTRLGDPIEAAALREVYANRLTAQPLRIAALKACIGHASEAAGIAGLISTLLAMRHGMFPPIVGFNSLNSHIRQSDNREDVLAFSSQTAIWPLPDKHPRRAAISSFGLSGTNVHILVEQAQTPTVLPTAQTGPFLFLLSAAALPDLERRRRDLALWLSEQGDTILPALAHTLLWHREAMACRWGAYAHSVAELREKLASADDRPTDPLLGLWLAGQNPQQDWLLLPAYPPLALPSYPFYGSRLWSGAVLAETGSLPEPDPLLGSLQADGSFLREFHASDPLVADHQVAGQALLHAGVLLEICLAAINRQGSDGSILSEFAWLKPLAVSGTVQVNIRLQNGTLAIVCNDTVYATAQVSASSSAELPKTLDPAALLASLPPSVVATGQSSDTVFLGASFPGPEQIRADGWQAVAFLEHASSLPTILDAAIRTAAAAIGSAETDGLRLRFPARLAQLRHLAPLPKQGFYFHARRRTKGLPRSIEAVDITVYDRDGMPLLYLDGLTLAAAFEPTSEITAQLPPQHEASSWRIIWQETPVTSHCYREESLELLIADAQNTLASQLGETFPDVRRLGFTDVEQAAEGLSRRANIWFFDDGVASRVMDLFRLLQALAKAGYATAEISLKIITGKAIAIGDESVTNANGAALLGLAKAASREFPTWRMRLIDCDPETANDAGTIDRLLREPGDPLGEIVALRSNNRRYLQRLVALDKHNTAATIRFSRYDHIIILGGMGRLGRACARHLAQHYQARLSLIGRSPETGEQLGILEELRTLGSDARYFMADIRDAAQLEAVLDQALVIHGPARLLIQATVDPAFARLERALAEEFEAALSPKILGLGNVGKALATRPIAALAVFSSIGAFTGFPANDGQASYSAGCNFEASHAQQLMRELSKPVRIIHWGLWDSGDYGQDALARLQTSGLEPMALEHIGDTLEALLRTPYPQLVHAQLATETWLDLGALPNQPVTAAFAEAARQALASHLVPNDRPGNMDAAKALLAHRISDGLMAVFTARGFTANVTLSVAEASAKLAVLASHRQLARALLNMAVRHGLGAWDKYQTYFTFFGSSGSASLITQIPDTPGLESSLRLLDRCLDALPQLLAGERPGTDILFPAGAMDWVEPIYRDQPVLADCSHRLAGAVVATVAKGGRRILEIGAGTGSTAGPVLDALRAAGLEADSHYVYSDISKAFVRHGQARFGQRLADAKVLDISRSPETQGFELAAWDIIIASNVLHATADMRHTLSNVAALLAPGGIVLINEMVEPDDFATLTFGLLDGWWESQDPGCRLADGPILGIAGWQDCLRRVGLQGRWAYDRYGDTDSSNGGQSILLAFKPTGTSLFERPVATAPSATPKTTTAHPSPTQGSADAQSQCEIPLRNILAQILGMAVENIERERPFMEMGVDSLIAPQIAEEVQAQLACPLRVTDIYKYGNLAALANHLASSYPDRFRPSEPEAEPMPQTQTPSTLPSQDGIAIIGLSARFAGAPTIDALWKLLDEGRHAITPVERFDISPWFDEKGGTDKTYARWGGFLDDYDRFDPYFFNITPAEAEVMDPQQRVLMEETWKALENAGLDPNSLAAMNCGLFVGASANNYQTKGSSGLRTLGSSMAILSARMAYVLNLHGPNFPIDTGCSSSLVAVHQACQSLRSGECDLALAGGVSVNLISPDIYLYLSDAGMISHQGIGRTFDDAADGFVPGEGAGMVVLKRLSDALADGDRIDAVIIGSGVNQDGRTAGLTAPSSAAQAALTQSIYQRYGLNPANFGMIEAHGTGTPLGDPIEVQALTDTFRRYTERRGGCAIGSVKTNIGHTMAAAGMAGIAKTVLALRHRRIPASLNFSLANRHIDFADTPFFVPTQSVPWPEGRAAQAAVSSFGFSGTNAHIVLQAGINATSETSANTGPWLFAVSARDPDALKRRLLDLANYLREQTDALDLARVAETLARGRAHWRYRRAIIASDLPTLVNALEQAASLPATAVPNDHIPQTIAVPLPPEDLAEVAARYQQGDIPDWQALFGSKKPPLALLGYPFARERFWAMATPSVEQTDDYPIGPEHLLLNAHRVAGTAILPGTLSLELLRGDAVAIENVAWLRPLSLADVPARLRLVGTEVRELMTTDNSRLAQGRIGDSKALTSPPPDFAPSIRLDGDELYRRLAASGFDYGKPLQVIDSVEIGRGFARARLLPPAELQNDPLLLGAALLDGALQTAAAIGHSGNGDAAGITDGQWVPHRLDALRVRERLSGLCTATAWLEDSSDEDRLIFNVLVQNDEGTVLAGFEGMTAHRLTLPETRPYSYQPAWQVSHVLATLPAPAAIVLYDASARWADILRQAFPDAQCLAISADENSQATQQALSELPAPLLVIQTLPEQTPLAGSAATVANALAAADPLPTVRSAFELVRTLLLAGRQDDVRLLTLASAAVNTPIWNAAATVAGLYRTLKIEAPGVDARVLLSASSAVLEVVLAREIQAVAEPDPLIYYDETLLRQGRTWQALPIPSEIMLLPKGKGTVLISGGLGGLGLALAERLAQEGAEQIALLSRSAVNVSQQARIASIEKSGATVMTLAVDVGNLRALSNALNTIRDTLGPISAVYHLAGVLQDGFLLNKDKQALAEVFHAKVRGAILLDELTRNDPLDSFVLFGSTAAVFGSVGQADYGAANAFLAAFADTRQARGDKTLCVHWPLWADGGMQPSADATAFLNTLGMKALPSAVGFGLLAQLAHSAATGSALLLYGDSGLFGRLQSGTISRRATHSIKEGQLAANAGLTYLCQLLAAIVKLPPERIEPDVAFEELGIDSIAIMKLNRQMENDLGPIAKTLFFEYRTPETLAAHLQQSKTLELAAYFQTKTPVLLSEPSLETALPNTVPRPTTISSAAPVTQDAIAIVGVAGLYPMAANLDEFWDNLQSGRDCIGEIPPERWPLQGFYDPDPKKAATSHCKWGGFIDDADCFDTRFFGIAPLEAETLDPQARKFLEISWNALENAGLDPERMFDSLGDKERQQRRCGVFVGVMYGDYQLFGPEEAQKGNLIGPNADYWNIANRVSAFLDLHGPSMAVDTACSSSLSAIHLACQAIRSGDCVMAIAGGVNLCLHPRRHWILSKAGMAASDGRCHSFGAGGDGYVPGEGIGAVILKPLARAQADGDRIQGIILGSALNHGGRTSGYTVPNPVAQGDAVRSAMSRAGIDPRSISYLEAHGTGTPLGDPIEIRGLARAFSEAMPENCVIGSVKGNIGHLESAAGIAGLTKVLLQMRKRTLAPTLYADPPNPDIDLSGTGFRFATQQETWQGSPLRAGISSFGAGGANAHLIIEAGEVLETRSVNTESAPQILLVSARDIDALRQRAGSIASHLLGETGQQQSLADIAYTLAVGRKAFGERLAVIGANKNDLANLLQRFAVAETSIPHLWHGRAGKNIPPATDNDLARLAAAWVAGSPAPTLLGHRVELPAYPFAKRRLWVNISAAQPIQAPLIATKQQFFADQPPLSDHLIAGRALLPGAFSLLAALEAAPEQSLREVRWPMPGIATSGQALTIRCECQDGQVTVLSDRQEHLLQAYTAAIPTAPDIADISSFIALCPRHLDAETIYSALASAGAEYGPSLQALDSVFCGDGIAVAHLRDGYSAPAVLDAAFQLCFALIPEQLSGQALLPAKLGQITVTADLSETLSLIAMRRETHSRGIIADFYLMDGSGKTLAWLDGFQALAASAIQLKKPDADLPEAEPLWPLRLLRPEWTPIPLASKMWIPQHPWILTETANDALGLALSQHWHGELAQLGDFPTELPDAVVIILSAASPELVGSAPRTGRLLENLRQYLREWTSTARPPALLLLARTTDDNAFNTDPCAAAIAAFLRAAARERPDWPLVTLSLPNTVWDDLAQGLPLPTAVLTALPETMPADAVPPERALRHGVLWQRFLAPVELPASPPPWREGEVILIAGAGGLGGLLARHAAACAKVSVAFLGRSPTPNAATAEAIVTLQNGGNKATYWQADLADPLAIASTTDAVVSTLGPIDWLVHTALVMGDAPIVGLTAEMLQNVLAPKTLGLTNLSQHIQPRRGLLLFSSSNALTANPGQAAYAAASAFVDAAAAQLPYPVHVFDWGFWGETGAVADATHQTQLAKLGVLPIRDREGLEAMEQVISAGLPRVAVLRVADHLLQPMGVDLRRTDYWRSQPSDALVTSATQAARQAQLDSNRFADPAIEVLNRYAAERLWQALADCGVALGAGEQLDALNLGRMLNATADYQPLVAALADLLQRAGLCDATGRSTGFAISSKDLAKQRQTLETEVPETAPTLELLERCLLALGDIVAGRRDAAAVLFGDGEAAVAALYRGNPVVDHFQALVANSVAGAVRAAEQGNQVLSILEVGTGTGGTTGFVLQALANSTAWRYRITDLSMGLVNATAERLDPEKTRLDVGRLDVNQAFAPQGVMPGNVDIVIAANVLHATPDLLTVLLNIKEALRPGGLLILNEATSRQDINTLTFGLTPGWWAYRDAPRRCPHGPLLDPGRWLDTLAEAGFTVSDQFGLPLATGGEHPLQSVIIAVADAYARSQTPVASATKQSLAKETSVISTNTVGSASTGLEQTLQILIADTLRLEPDELSLDDSFADHGADSILSVELVRRINTAFGIDLKSTALFNYATVRELSGYMVREHGVAGITPTDAKDERADDAKQRSRRLRDVIERRRAATPVNREAEFWQRETGQAPTDSNPANGQTNTSPTSPPQMADLDEVLRLLETGAMSVSQAMELNYADE